MGAKLSFASVDLSGRVAIVTGSNSGTGYEAAKAMAGFGAKVIMACRSQERAQQAIERMKEEVPDKPLDVEFARLDLSSLKSTADFADRFLANNDKLNILCCNAGYYGNDFRVTQDGMESVFQTNYLGHLLLITRLLPLLKASEPDPRIVSVSSAAHQSGNFCLAKTHQQSGFSSMRTYGTSKLFQIMMTGVLHRRLKDTGITSIAVHPGIVQSEFGQDSGMLRVLYGVSGAVGVSRTSAQGAASILYSCLNPELAAQETLYVDSCKGATPNRLARNEEKQEQLFQYSLSLLKDHLKEDGCQLLGVDLSKVEAPTTGSPVAPPSQAAATAAAGGAATAVAASAEGETPPDAAAGTSADKTSGNGDAEAPAAATEGSSEKPAAATADELAATSAHESAAVAGVDEPAPAEQAAATEAPAEETAAVVGGEETAVPEEPAAVEQAAATEEPAASEPAAVAEELAATAEAPPAEEPGSVAKEEEAPSSDSAALEGIGESAGDGGS